MRPITVNKGELLDILRKNRDAHRAIFEEALEGYRKKVVEVLEERLEEARKGRKWDVYVHLTQPEDHTRDYTVAIDMLTMSLSDTAELDEQSFRSFVKDDWQWKRQFLASNSLYSATATKVLGAMGDDD